MHEGSRRAIVAAFLANLGIAIAKFVGFAITGSAGLLAEAIHSVADTGNQGLLMIGSRRARRQPTREHPFGYGRERYFWAFVVALVLFSLGGLFALVEGIEKLIHPHEPENLGVAILILLVAVALETFSLRTAVRESRPLKGKSSWWGFIRRTKQPELPVVLLEDTGAEIGLFFALAGILLAHFTGNARWDAVGSLAIGVLLVVIAIVLAVEMKGLLIGEAAAPDVERRIQDAMQASPEVRGLIHLRTEHLGPDDVLVAAKLDFDPLLTVGELAAVVDAAEARVRAVEPQARLIFIEADVARPDAPSPAPPSS